MSKVSKTQSKISRELIGVEGLTMKQIGFCKDYVATGDIKNSVKMNYNIKKDHQAQSFGTGIMLNNKLVQRGIISWANKVGLTDEKIARRLNESLDAEKLVVSPTEPDKYLPDWQARLKGIELALKVKGHLKQGFENPEQLPVNIEKVEKLLLLAVSDKTLVEGVESGAA